MSTPCPSCTVSTIWLDCLKKWISVCTAFIYLYLYSKLEYGLEAPYKLDLWVLWCVSCSNLCTWYWFVNPLHGQWVHALLLKGKLVDVPRNEQAWRGGQSGKAALAREVLSSILIVELKIKVDSIHLLLTPLVILFKIFESFKLLPQKYCS